LSCSAQDKPAAFIRTVSRQPFGVMKARSPYAALAQRNSILSAGLSTSTQQDCCGSSARLKKMPKAETNCSANPKDKFSFGPRNKTQSSVDTGGKLEALSEPEGAPSPSCLILSHGRPRGTLRRRSRSSPSCPVRGGHNSDRHQKGDCMFCSEYGGHRRREEAPVLVGHTLVSAGGQQDILQDVCACDGGAGTRPAEFCSSLLPSHSIQAERWTPATWVLGSCQDPPNGEGPQLGAVDPVFDTGRPNSWDAAALRSERGSSPVPAIQCGMPGSFNELTLLQVGMQGGLERLNEDDGQACSGPKWGSSDSCFEELSTRVPSESSGLPSPECSCSTNFMGSPRLTSDLVSELSESNPLLCGLEWESRPESAQLDLLDALLGASALDSQAVGAPALPAHLLGRRPGAYKCASLFAARPSAGSACESGDLGGLLSPSSTVQVETGGGRLEQARILVVDHSSGTYKIRTLDGRTKIIQANTVWPVA